MSKEKFKMRKKPEWSSWDQFDPRRKQIRKSFDLGSDYDGYTLTELADEVIKLGGNPQFAKVDVDYDSVSINFTATETDEEYDLRKKQWDDRYAAYLNELKDWQEWYDSNKEIIEQKEAEAREAERLKKQREEEREKRRIKRTIAALQKKLEKMS